MRDRPLSAPQIRMLRGVLDHGEPTAYFRGLSEHGGAHWTLQSLLKRHLVELTGENTAAGRPYARLTTAGFQALDAATSGRVTRGRHA